MSSYWTNFAKGNYSTKLDKMFLAIALLTGLASCEGLEEMDTDDPDEMDTEDTDEVDPRWSPPWKPPIEKSPCGNWDLDPGEECDDGNAKNDDICTQGCKWAYCGDGFVFVGVEQCDDGNDIDNDACSNECKPKSRIPPIEAPL